MKTHDFTQAKVFLIVLSLLFIGLVGHSQGDWSNFRGPGYDWETTVPEGEQPVTDGPQVRQIFESEAFIGKGANTGGLNTYTAGAATPIHYNGNVYLWYFRPNGDTLRLLNNNQRKYPDMLDENGWGEADWDVDDYYPTADDIIICVDGETGETKWKKVFPKVGINLPGHKTTYNNMTMVAANGKVYAVGSSYWLYCFDAKTGKVEWKSKEHPSFDWIQGVRQKGIDEANINPFSPGSNREFNGALLFVDGKLLAPTGRKPHKYAAFDPSDGSLLWTSDAFNGGKATPAVWNNGGKKYLIGQNGSTMNCVDPDDGSIVWSETGLGDAKNPVYLKNDYVFTPLETSDGEGSGEGYIGCYKLAEAGPSFQWQAHVNVYPIGNNTGFFVKQDTVYARMDYDLYMYDLATGDSLGKIDVPAEESGFDDQAIMVKANNTIFSARDVTHSGYTFDLIDTKTDKPTGVWDIWQTTVSYGSHLIPSLTDSLMTFRTSKVETNGIRIIGYDITQPEGPVRVDIDQAQTVVVEGQTATISATASSSAGSISKVEFYDDSGNKLGEASSSPYEIELDKSQGTYPIRAKAIDGAGNSKMSHSALLTVKKWYPNLRPDTIHLRTGEKFRPYPHIFGSKWDELLSPQFQIQNDNEGVNSGVILQWPLVEGGYIDYPDGKPEKYIYIANESGIHHLVCGIIMNEEIKYDTSIVIVNKNEQTITFENTPNIYVSDPPLKLEGTSSSGLPVEYAIEKGGASVSNDTLYPESEGEVVIKAMQPGNSNYKAAAPVYDTILVKADAEIGKIVTDPATLTIQQRDVQVFTATVYDQYGDKLLVQPSVSWSINDADGGSIDADGIYTADTILGDYEIYAHATLNGTEGYDTIPVTVTKPFYAISINFRDDGCGECDIPSNMPAGYIVKANWNNLTSSDGTDLMDEDGKTTTLDVSLPDAGQDKDSEQIDPVLGNDMLFKSFIGNWQNVDAELTDIPDQFVNQGFDVYVYWQTHNDDTQIPGYTLNGESYYLKDSDPAWTGELSQSMATSPGDAKDGVDNYVKFSDISSDSIHIEGSNNGPDRRMGISGIQIVTEGTLEGQKEDQTITFSQSDLYIEGYPTTIELSGTSTSGMPVYYTVVSGPASVKGDQLTITSEGDIEVEAWHPGNIDYNPAQSVYDTFNTQYKIDQTISFSLPDTVYVGSLPSDISLDGTASSGLTVNYTLSAGIGNISGNTLTVNNEGFFSVTATQEGNDKYSEATPVTQKFEVVIDASEVEKHVTTIDSEGPNIYPNPTTGVIKFSSRADHVQVFTTIGRKILDVENVSRIDLTGKPDGIYFIKAGNAVTKVIKK